MIGNFNHVEYLTMAFYISRVAWKPNSPFCLYCYLIQTNFSNGVFANTIFYPQGLLFVEEAYVFMLQKSKSYTFYSFNQFNPKLTLLSPTYKMIHDIKSPMNVHNVRIYNSMNVTSYCNKDIFKSLDEMRHRYKIDTRGCMIIDGLQGGRNSIINAHGLVQERRNSIANALRLRLSSTIASTHTVYSMLWTSHDASLWCYIFCCVGLWVMESFETKYRAKLSVLALSQCEAALICNVFSHWLGTSLESALKTGSCTVVQNLVLFLFPASLKWVCQVHTNPNTSDIRISHWLLMCNSRV